MSYTNKDLDNAINYSNNRYTLRIINTMFQKFPHLISHLEYSIEQADFDTDYYYPASFSKRAIKVVTNIPQKLCSKISCNGVMAESICTKNTPASYYNIGDSSEFKRQCEPACFNLLKDPVIDEETGEEQIQMMTLDYNDTNGCIILPTSYIWHEHPFFRSDVVYAKRLNDLPVGFNYDTPDLQTYSQRTYKYNKSYCDAYYDQWNGTTCVKKFWEVVLYAVVGESIVKMVKGGIQNIENGYKSSYPPVTLPSIPDIEDVWTVEGWQGDIDTDFVLPPVEYEIPDAPRQFVQRENLERNHQSLHVDDYVKRVEFIKKIKNQQSQISSTLRRKLETNFDVKLNRFEIKEIDGVKKSTVTLISKTNGEETSIDQLILEVINGLLESVFNSAFWIDIGIGITSDFILDQVKIIFRKLANSILPKLTEKILAYSGKMLSVVFSKALYATIANTMSKIVIKTVSKVMIQVTKLMAELASVVGVILAIITIFDILLTIWDPMGFNNKFDQEILNSVTRSSDIAMRQSLETTVPKMSLDIFANICLSAEEILDESLNTFSYVYEYLDSLTVNAEGSRIDKGEEIDFNGGLSDETVDQAIVNSKLVTPKELYDYENEHNQRMQFFTVPTKIITSLIIISALCMIIDLWTVALLIYIVIVTIAMFTYLNASTLNMGQLLKDTKLMISSSSLVNVP